MKNTTDLPDLFVERAFEWAREQVGGRDDIRLASVRNSKRAASKFDHGDDPHVELGLAPDVEDYPIEAESGFYVDRVELLVCHSAFCVAAIVNRRSANPPRCWRKDVERIEREVLAEFRADREALTERWGEGCADVPKCVDLVERIERAEERYAAAHRKWDRIKEQDKEQGRRVFELANHIDKMRRAAGMTPFGIRIRASSRTAS